MRMRTQAEVILFIRENDPQTAITPHALRQMVLSGKIPSVQVGRKRLIDLDNISNYLTPGFESEANAPGYGMIRPLNVK